MEELVSRQNNTPALLMAHNGLAKLLKNSWPWLLGGVVDAPRLLSRLCEIYRDGLDQVSTVYTGKGVLALPRAVEYPPPPKTPSRNTPPPNDKPNKREDILRDVQVLFFWK